jgi:glutamate/tyrosine decarboxylase-like PLP-dependent enzyme
MLEKIRLLEQASIVLEPPAEERNSLQRKTLEYTEDFLERISELPAYVTTREKGAGITASPIVETPENIDTLLGLLGEHVDRPGLNPASGGHLGYIPGGGIYVSALADYVAAVTNRYAGVFFAGPGAVRMENMLLNWMADIVGYPKGSGGNLTSGGSIANLVGIATARDAMEVKASDIERSVIYLTGHAHHSVDKAIRIAGLKECICRSVPMDQQYRMDADALRQSIRSDKQGGLRPWLVIASADTTDVGAVDPLDEIAEIARANDLWFHVDGAYGGFFVLCEEGKNILKGMEKSDSLVMDPHKGLFLPYGSGAVIVKSTGKMFETFRYQANYLQDALTSIDELSPADLSPELTKHFRGLRLWLPLKYFGVSPFRAALEEKLFLARYFHEQIREVDGFSVGGYPDLSVATFWYTPKRGDPNEFNAQLIREVQSDGRVFLSSTMLGGKFILRVAVLCFRTHLRTIDLTIQILKEKVKKLAG